MDSETKRQFIITLQKVQKGFQKDRSYLPSEMLHLAQELIARQAYLLPHLIEAEKQFRIKIKELELEGKSHASAESGAKALQDYQNYKFADMVYKLCEQEILLIKKMTTALETEYQKY